VTTGRFSAAPSSLAPFSGQRRGESGHRAWRERRPEGRGMAATARIDGSDIEERGLKLGRELGRGGQGAVIELGGAHAGLAFKRYFRGDADAAALKRLVDMPADLPAAERERLRRQTAWPLARVMSGNAVAGFVMQSIPDRFSGHAGRRPIRRELQYLLYEPKPMWGDIRPPAIEGRLELAREIASLMRFLHAHLLIAGDISMSNLLWAWGRVAEIFLIDCDGIRRLGSRPVSRQADTPDWTDPKKVANELDLDNDRYKCALLIGRVLSRMPYAYPGDPLPLLPGIPDRIGRRVQALWQQAGRGRGCRPHANSWLSALASQ
jgi:DNA-binding helix-hairpin-helix protein with protein kinase domain